MGGDLGQHGKALPRLGLATWGPSFSGRAFGSLALPRGGAAVGGRARGEPPRSCPQVAPAPTNPLYASHTRREAAGRSPGGGGTPDPHAHDEEHQDDAIGKEVQKQSLAARQRVRGNTTPHPSVNDGCLPEPVKSAYGVPSGSATPPLDRTHPTGQQRARWERQREAMTENQGQLEAV